MRIVEEPKLPKEIFAVKVAPKLLAQAVRVHLANQRAGTQSALTRAQVDRTRKKLYRQKGTGGARHGDRKAPIFVGGGVAFAPKPRDYTRNLPKKMRRLALSGALTEVVKANKVSVVSGLGKLAGKTKELAAFLDEINKTCRTHQIKDKGSGTKEKKREKGKWLIVTDITRENIWQAGRNIAGVTILPFNQLNTYEVMKAEKILLMEEAIIKLTQNSKLKSQSQNQNSKRKKTIRMLKKPR